MTPHSTETGLGESSVNSLVVSNVATPQKKAKRPNHLYKSSMQMQLHHKDRNQNNTDLYRGGSHFANSINSSVEIYRQK